MAWDFGIIFLFFLWARGETGGGADSRPCGKRAGRGPLPYFIWRILSFASGPVLGGAEDEEAGDRAFESVLTNYGGCKHCFVAALFERTGKGGCGRWMN